jgi:hypothetical protein
LAWWSKNRGKIVLAMQSGGKTGLLRGIAFWSQNVTPDLQGTCVQGNRLLPVNLELTGKASSGLLKATV